MSQPSLQGPSHHPLTLPVHVSVPGSTCRYYYDQLYDYVQSKLLSDPALSGYRLVFTGHSLGGGVAQIVGARLRRPAVTFSAPGVVLSRRKFRISLDDINDFLLNVQTTHHQQQQATAGMHAASPPPRGGGADVLRVRLGCVSVVSRWCLRETWCRSSTRRSVTATTP